MSYRLFVVAGENEILRSLSGQLGEDIEVTILETANDALWEVRSEPPEAILADINLPDMSGLEMAEILPSFEVPTKVLLYSREHNPAAQKQAEDYGVYGFLHEPLSIDELRATLREAVSSPRERSSPAPHAMPEAPAPPPEPESGSPVTEPSPPELESATPMPEPLASDTEARAKSRRFTPARVRLPPMSERFPQSSRTVTRTRTAVEEKPLDQTPAHPAEPQRRRGSTLVLTEDNLAPIQSIMSRLAQDLGTQCIMLTDRAGMVLVEVGTTHDLPTMILLPLLSTSFSTAGEVARQLREADATTLYIHEGINYDLYCFDIAQRFLLVLVFNKKVASSKIGTVWISTKRAIRELQDALS